jgi:hypothetical protein
MAVLAKKPKRSPIIPRKNTTRDSEYENGVAVECNVVIEEHPSPVLGSRSPHELIDEYGEIRDFKPEVTMEMDETWDIDVNESDVDDHMYVRIHLFLLISTFLE